MEIQFTVKGKAQIIERNLRIFIETKGRNVAGPQEHQKPCNKHCPNSRFSFTVLLNPSYYPLLVPSPTIYPLSLLAYALWFTWWKTVCVSFVSPNSSTLCSKTWTWLAFDHKAHKSWEWKPLARLRPLPILQQILIHSLKSKWTWNALCVSHHPEYWEYRGESDRQDLTF